MELQVIVLVSLIFCSFASEAIGEIFSSIGELEKLALREPALISKLKKFLEDGDENDYVNR
jgi:hypothetical protein